MDSITRLEPRTSLITRRKFLTAAGSALALASIPIGARIARASGPPILKFGGPTPNSKFYVTSYASTPTVDASSWNFTVKGLVENPLRFSYADIRKLPAITQMLTLECISNPPDGTAISNANWTGVKLRPILNRAKVKRGAKFVAMRGADGYHTVLPVEELMREENFLPYLMNGDPLPAAHGFPVRIFIPGKYGMKQPKWITEIEFVDREFQGYWEQRGWSHSAWRRVNSGFFSPKPSGGVLSLFGGSAEVSGPIDIVGWALAGPSGIKRVEISTDNGVMWREAEIVDNSSPYVWTVWQYRFEPINSGKHLVCVRATDGNGVSQTPEDHGASEGLSGQARIELNVHL